MSSVRVNMAYLGSILRSVFYQYSLQFHLKRCIEYFFQVWLLIHRPVSESSAARSIALHSLQLILLLTTYRTVIFVWLTILNTDLSTFWRILLWDQMLFQDADPFLNFAYIFYGIGCSYIFVRIYLHRAKKKKRETIWLLLQYLLKGDYRFRDERLMWVEPKKSRAIMRRFWNIHNYYDKYFELIYYYYLFKVIQYIFDNWSYFFCSPLGYLALMSILLNGLSAFIYMYLLLIQYLLNTLCFELFSYATFVRLKQIMSLILTKGKGHRTRRFAMTSFAHFGRLHTEILLDIFEANQIFGYTLLAVVLLCTPTSAYQLILILTKPLSRLIVLTNLNLIMYKSILIVILHLVAGLYSNRIHRCNAPLLTLCASSAFGKHSRSHYPLGWRVRLSLYVEKFHTKKRYGLTYASYGLISCGSFFKYTLLYTEMLMYCYKLINNI